MKITAPIKGIATLLFVDLSLLITSMSLATLLRLGHPLFIFFEYRGAMSFCLILYPFAMYMAHGYDILPQASILTGLRRPVLGIALAALFASFVFYFAKYWRFGRGIFVLMNLLFAIGMIFWRSAYSWDTRRRRLRVVIAGEGPGLEDAAQVLSEHMVRPQIVLMSHDDSGSIRYSSPDGIPNGQMISEPDLFILVGHSAGPEIARVATECKFRGVEVWDLPRLYSELAERLPASHIGDSWLATADGFRFFSKHTVKILKRISDVAIASIGLILGLPILLAALILIKLEDRGRVFYSQERVGCSGDIFRIYKLRTMIPDAEKNTGPVWSSHGDSRVTRVGRFLRKSRIDEIPQMWNVLRGDMSFVGPRPERPTFVEPIQQKYPIYGLRHLVRPGITGWAQVTYPYGASEDDAIRKLEYDLYYIQHISLLFDLRIIFKTASVVLWGWGGR